MHLNRRLNVALRISCATVWAVLLFAGANSLAAQQPGTPDGPEQPEPESRHPASDCAQALGSPYIPVDSWVYPAMLRLYSLGFVDKIYLGLRPWTRATLGQMLEEAGAGIEGADPDGDPSAGEAQDIYEALNHFLHSYVQGPCKRQPGNARVESVYSIARAISGTSLHDSFHLGSTIINDYGRPYESGFNNYSGASGYATAGRFALYVRGEFQGAQSAVGYSAALAQALSTIDGTLYQNSLASPPQVYNQATIPMGRIGTATDGRFLEAYVSYQYLNHVLSFGKQDDWLGPGQGGAMAFSNNAQNFYSFHVNRIEPLYVPFLSRFTGPFRYEFLIGGLRGHTEMLNPEYEANPSPSQPNVINPGDPWVHLEKISFRPSSNLEFGFERTVIWGGEGHSPVNVRDFLRSFFSTYSPSLAVKNGPADPGARFGAFDASYRLPFLRKWLTLYGDSNVHDDVSPIDNPPRAAYRLGLYLSHVPRIPKLDVRFEAVSTDPFSATPATKEYGHFIYWETIERQGYTNQGQLFGDWIGREDKGGQAWMSYHLSGNEWLQVSARNQKATKDFIPGSTSVTFSGPGCVGYTACLLPGGTTLNDLNLQAVKRIGRDFEVNGNFSLEHWTAPIYMTGRQNVTTTNIQLTWFPERKVSF